MVVRGGALGAPSKNTVVQGDVTEGVTIGQVNAAIATHVGQSDPHEQYALESGLSDVVRDGDITDFVTSNDLTTALEPYSDAATVTAEIAAAVAGVQQSQTLVIGSSGSTKTIDPTGYSDGTISWNATCTVTFDNFPFDYPHSFTLWAEQDGDGYQPTFSDVTWLKGEPVHYPATGITPVVFFSLGDGSEVIYGVHNQDVKVLPCVITGPLVPDSTSCPPWYIDHRTFFIGHRVSARIAPAGADLILDINLNDTTMCSGTKPTLSATELDTGIQNEYTTLVAEPGSFLTVDVDQSGLTNPGEGIVLKIYMVEV